MCCVASQTVVSAQCYTTQRDPTAFPHADKFNPERWLTDDPMSQEARDLFMPFSKGTRACLGRNLAFMELRQVTSALLLKYNVSAAPGTTSESMEMRDHFLASPKSGRCELLFHPL
jgi:cytochrome P450